MDCVREGSRGVRRGTTVAGAELGGRPIIVPTLIVVNVAVFALTVAQAGSLGGNAAAPLFRAWSLVPLLVDGEWWRVLTSGFLHFGPVHLLFNMLALWIIGREVEVVLGRGRFLAVYLLGVLGGAAAAMLFSAPDIQLAGASGAVFGLMGALVVLLRRMRAPAGQVFGLIAINIAISFLPGISLTAHLGGLVAGAAATAALVYAPARSRTTVQVGALGALAVLLVAVIAAVAMI